MVAGLRRVGASPRAVHVQDLEEVDHVVRLEAGQQVLLQGLVRLGDLFQPVVGDPSKIF